MTVSVNARINTLPARRIMPDTNNAKLVLQTEFALVSRGSRKQRVKTVRCGECIAVPIISSLGRVGGLVHFDVKTSVAESVDQVVLPEFQRLEGTKLEAQMLGGMLTDDSIALAREVRDVLQARGIKLIGMDLNNPEKPVGYMLDMNRVEVFDLQRPLLPQAGHRHEQVLRHIMENPDSRMIRLVEQD